ncbi:hypothetical protein B4119_0825 [Parageobacillus caldoxylosilyticus]|uniref:Uncharacterized protein n=1 Tax=Saccharococcus caldoxylosilyticus TaxID=81408 RepID=A0A150LE07_9BACL|nr:hypothetical protein B4119_0825 [Parageobacillus caldoxylosilyticus]
MAVHDIHYFTFLHLEEQANCQRKQVFIGSSALLMIGSFA